MRLSALRVLVSYFKPGTASKGRVSAGWFGARRPQGDGMELVGATARHADNHWGTSGILVEMRRGPLPPGADTLSWRY